MTLSTIAHGSHRLCMPLAAARAERLLDALLLAFHVLERGVAP